MAPGAHAEYVCVRESRLIAQIPEGTTFEEAAAVPDGAYQGFLHLKRANVGPGTRLLVYGASGSCGTAAVQLGKHYFGAHVTAVCNGRNVELVRSLGADEVVDYEQEDFTRRGERYDVVLDAVGKHSFVRSRRALADRGMYVATDRLYNVPLALLTRWSKRKVVFAIERRIPRESLMLRQGADRGWPLPGGRRPHVPPRAGRRGGDVRRQLAEGRQRRPHRERRAGTMRAAVRERFGSPDVVEIRDLDKPVPADDEVLVRIRASSLNLGDWYAVLGRPYVGRTAMGLRKPKEERLGTDYAGVVEAVGKDVKDFQPGDEVFGGRTGALAEYVVAKAERAIVPKPPTASFEEAAAVPVAALTALQALRDKGKLEPGQRVLVHGASGGVGTFAVLVAKALGAEVTAVCSTRSVEQARTLGADHVVDYTKDDFSRDGRRYDLMIDVAGTRSWSACKRGARAERDARHRRRPEEGPPARAARRRGREDARGCVQQPQGRVLHREVQQAGHGVPARAARGREADAGDRQAVRTGRDRRRASLHGRRAPAGEDRHHDVTQLGARAQVAPCNLAP